MIKELAVVHGRVTLSSGQEADWYIDLRRVLLDGRAAPVAGRVMLDVTESLDYRRGGRADSRRRSGRDRDAARRRGQGPQTRRVRGAQDREGARPAAPDRGPDVAGRRVLAVEDTSTTGGSVLTAVDALQEAGAAVVGVAVVVERGARARIAERGLPYLPAFELADLGLS